MGTNAVFVFTRNTPLFQLGFKGGRRLRAGERLAEFFKLFKKALNNPQVKCIRQSGVYCIFLCLLFVEVTKDQGRRNTVKYNKMPDKTEYLIMTMVVGFFVQVKKKDKDKKNFWIRHMRLKCV